MKKSLLLISLIMSVITAQPGGFSVPNAISFQGMLTNVDGSVYQDGDYELTFRLIRIIQGGTEQVIWEEIHTAAVSNGVFSVILGSNTPLPQNVPGNAMLETQVGEEILVPRQPLTSVPFALRSNRAQFSEQALRSDSSGFAQMSHHSVFADTSAFALNAPTAINAMHATYADTSMVAGQSHHSIYADTSMIAGQSHHSIYADTSMIAGQSHHSIYADTSMIAGQSHHSIYADTSMIAGQSHHSIYADTADYVINGGATDINGLSDALIESFSMYIGEDPSFTTSSATYNVAVGITAMGNVTSGKQNVAVGFNALEENTSGERNVGLGYQALENTTTGSMNTGVGRTSLPFNTTGDGNTGIGDFTLYNNSIGDYNVAIGQGAGSSNTTGSNNVFIGKLAGNNSNHTTADNKLVIANSNTTTPLIEGDFNDATLKVNGSLSVTGSMQMSIATTITSNTTYNGTETIIPVNTSINEGLTITIDSDQLVPGRILIFKQIAGDGNQYSIDTEGSEQIQIANSGLSDTVAGGNWFTIRKLFTDGSNWYDF